MRVRMKIKISGTRDGEEWPDRGGEIDLPDDEAEQLLRYGAVETVTEPATADEDEDEGEQEPEETDPDPTPEEPDEETATAPDPAETRPRSRRKA